MKRVYIAGAYSSDNVLGVLRNISNGLRVSKEVMLAGYAVFSPWLDHQLVLMCNDRECPTVQHLQSHSIAWLEVSDAVVLVPGWEQSNGTKKEIEIAEKLGIPVYSYDDFKKGGLESKPITREGK